MVTTRRLPTLAAVERLEVGMPNQPIAREHSAVIRLTPVAGLDPEECPAIVCCGGGLMSTAARFVAPG